MQTSEKYTPQNKIRIKDKNARSIKLTVQKIMKFYDIKHKSFTQTIAKIHTIRYTNDRVTACQMTGGRGGPNVSETASEYHLQCQLRMKMFGARWTARKN